MRKNLQRLSACRRSHSDTECKESSTGSAKLCESRRLLPSGVPFRFLRVQTSSGSAQLPDEDRKLFSCAVRSVFLFPARLGKRKKFSPTASQQAQGVRTHSVTEALAFWCFAILSEHI